jgi:hypothetical protein
VVSQHPWTSAIPPLGALSKNLQELPPSFWPPPLKDQAQEVHLAIQIVMEETHDHALKMMDLVQMNENQIYQLLFQRERRLLTLTAS